MSLLNAEYGRIDYEKSSIYFSFFLYGFELIFSGCAKEEEPIAEPKKVSYGEVIVEENTYENEYLGMGIQLPAEFEVKSAEALGGSLEDAKKMFENTELNEQIEQANMFMDLQAMNMSTGDNMNIIYQELNKQEWIEYSKASDDEIVSSILLQKDVLKRSYEEGGLEVENIQKGSVVLLGEKVATLETKVKAYGQTLCIVQVPKFNLGGKFGIMMTFTSLTLDGVQEMANACYKL